MIPKLERKSMRWLAAKQDEIFVEIDIRDFNEIESLRAVN